MTSRFRTAWRSRSRREQILLILLLAITVCMAVWLVILRPLADSLFEARMRHDRAVRTLAQAKTDTALLGEAQRRPPPPLDARIDSFVRQSAYDAGFPITSLNVDQKQVVTLASDHVRPQAFFDWLDRMETEHGLTIDMVTAVRNADRSLSVTVAFRARSL